MPFLRLDGYHAVSDITGIPDLFGRIKPTIKGLAPWSETPDEVTELKPWARSVVTGWVLIAVPVLLFMFGMMILSAPRVLATGLDSLAIQWGKLQEALDGGRTAQAAVGGIQSMMIVLPATGMVYSFSRIGKRIASGFWNITDGRPALRTSLGAVGVAAIAVAAFVLVPNGEYKPIQPGEEWTFTEGVEASSHLLSGRPSLTVEQEEELEGAPTLDDTDGSFVPSYEEEDAEDTGTSDEETDGEEDSTDEDSTDEDTTDEATPTAEPTEENIEETPTPEPS
jgi:putative peptide zinc metalloprotease protein